MRESRRRLWQDPAFRAQQLANLSRGGTLDSLAKARAVKLQKMKDDPEYRAQILGALAEARKKIGKRST